MAHELTIATNGKAEMAYIGETPWHGLGQKLQENATIEEMQAAAGMNWKILSAPAQYAPLLGGYDCAPRPMKGRQILYRNDTLDALSMVSDKYKIVQPSEVIGFFRDLVKVGGFSLDTAGTLYGGKKFWALAKIGEGAKIGGVDEVGGYLLISTSCDGSLATQARFTTVRVVCNNTLSLATKERSKNMVSVPHSTIFDPAAVQQQLGIAASAFDLFMADANHFARVKVSEAQAKAILGTIFKPAYATEGNFKPVEEMRSYKKVLELFNGAGKGAGMDTAKGTAWGLLNAVTEYYDFHLPARTQDARLNNTWFGAGADTKELAFDLIKLQVM